MVVAVLLFDEFETLDVFGPVEIFGRLKEHYQVRFYSEQGGLVSNSHGVRIATEALSSLTQGTDIFLIPGGYGTRKEVNNKELIEAIRKVSEKSRYVLTVCTGSALLARSGLLKGKSATSNKRAYEWVIQNDKAVHWKRSARWTSHGKFYTSSGVSAGMDMTLGFLSELHGLEFARQTAREIEYLWNEDKDQDPFA